MVCEFAALSALQVYTSGTKWILFEIARMLLTGLNTFYLICVCMTWLGGDAVRSHASVSTFCCLVWACVQGLLYP